MKFIVIGLGQFGKALALSLARDGHEVTAVDSVEENVMEVKDQVTYPLIGDAKDARFIRELDLSDEVTVFITIGENFESSMLVTAMLQERGVKHIYVRIINKIHARLLKVMGVEGIIQPEIIAASQLSRKFDNQSFLRHVEIDATHSLAEIKLPDTWAGQMLSEVMLRARYKLNLLTVRRGNALVEEKEATTDPLAPSTVPVIDFPEPSFIFEKGDLLILFGTQKALNTFVEDFQI